MAKRRPMSMKKSKKIFKKTAGNERVHQKNMLAVPRGGFRL